MKRFVLSKHAHRDLDEILSYLDSLPDRPALRIASSLQEALHSIISQFPYMGAVQSELTRLAGIEIRSRLVQSYRIIYMIDDAPEVTGYFIRRGISRESWPVVSNNIYWLTSWYAR